MNFEVFFDVEVIDEKKKFRVSRFYHTWSSQHAADLLWEELKSKSFPFGDRLEIGVINHGYLNPFKVKKTWGDFDLNK